METKYPIVLVHGRFGFDSLPGYPYFYKVQPEFEDEGCKVFVPALSALNSNEVRGEQLYRYLSEIRVQTGYDRFNLIGHSQGPLACRYVAANYPSLVGLCHFCMWRQIRLRNCG